MPHGDQCRVRIAEALQGTDAGRRRLEGLERRTSQQIAIEIQRDESKMRMDALLPGGRLLVMGRQLPATLSPRLSLQREIITDPEGVEAVRNLQSN